MKKIIFYLLIILAISSCAEAKKDVSQINQEQTETINYKYLALGDSYTIGESVCETCRYPAQLKDSLNTAENISGTVEIIAKTGWTTTDLINAIATENPSEDYNFVTLLIGVNNQYQHKPFSLYETEFPILLDDAIKFAAGDKTKVVVISIPDYAFTPYGESTNNQTQISTELDQYNNYAKQITEAKGVIFQDITDITRMGLEDPELVTSDGLHPSEKAYKKFVERLFANAKQKISN